MSDLHPDVERTLRLVGFVGGLLAIAIREPFYVVDPTDKYDRYGNPVDSPIAKAVAVSQVNEARAIADAVVEEAKRLKQETNTSAGR